MKFFAVLLVAFVAAAQANNVHEAWEKFKIDFGKTYDNSKEHAVRFSIFKNNFLYINEHNKLFEAGKSTYSLGVNAFTDLSTEEFVAQFNGFSAEKMVKDVANKYEPTYGDLPKSVDYRTKGYVTPVKNQGQCGSCWSFSATGSMEGAHFKKTGKLVSLSEQNLMDCDKKSYSCEGGLMDYAFKYVIKNKGIDTEASYQYKARDEQCEFKKADIGATISSYKDVTEGSEQDLTTAVANEGPISVAIDASHPSFQSYKSGVYNEPECGNTRFDLDHGVLVVGYGTDDQGNDYYIVKNSWGESWGNKGYINMSRNKKNQCGIATAASFPIA